MGDKNRKRVKLHHEQEDNKVIRQAEKAEERLVNFEINRAIIKAKVEGDRRFLAVAALVFLIGLILAGFGLLYLIGASLYG